jgi:hypothetical protein
LRLDTPHLVSKRKPSTKAFKLEAVRLTHEPDQRVVQVGKNLGMSAHCYTVGFANCAAQGQEPFPLRGTWGCPRITWKQGRSSAS